MAAATGPLPAPIGVRTLLFGGTVERIAGALLLWIAAWLILMILPSPGETVTRWMSLYDLPLGIFIAFLGITIWRNGALQARTRRGWLLIGIGYASTWAGNQLFSYYESVLQVAPFPSLADVFFLVAYPLMFAGMVNLSQPLQSSAERIKFALDIVTVMVAVLAFIGYFVLPQVGYDSAQQPIFEMAILTAYPLGDALIVFGVLSILLTRHGRRLHAPVALLLAAQAMQFVADIEFLFESAADAYQAGGASDKWFLVSFAVMMVAALDQYRRGAAFERVEVERHPYPYRLSPYIAVLSGYGLLAYDHLSSNQDTLRITLPTVFLLTCMVIARQIIAARDIARLHALQAERRAEHRFGTLVRHSSDVVLVTATDGVIRYASPSVERTLGWPPETLLGCNLAVLMHHDDIESMRAFLRRLSENEDVSDPVEYRVRNRDESWQHIEIIASNLSADPDVGGLVLNCRDVTDRRSLEDRLRHMAFHDPLTLLPNRNLFNERVQQALQRFAREQSRVAVMFVDLDNFKNINDSLGHEMGDKLLMAVAERLRRVVRPDDTVARLGGDEFSILLEDFKGAQDLSTLAARMADALHNPVFLAGKSVTVSGSIGIAIAGPGDQTQDLLRNADVAMYRAKASGKGGHEFFEASMHAQVLEHLELEMDIRRGLVAGEFLAHYQPIIDLRTNVIVGVEALMRWDHPRRGMVSPASFIPVAEASDLIVQLGRRILVEACNQAREWQQNHAEGLLEYVSVNISPRQLQQAGFVEDLREILHESGIAPGSLVLEITESLLLQNAEWTLQRLEALQGLGVRLALDDFGTGYSALSYLHQFPFDILKIDRSFVSKIADGANSDALVRAIVAMGSSLAMKTIAEGIETTAQFGELRRLGCDAGQGYLFSRPVPAEKLAGLLDAQRLGPTPYLAVIDEEEVASRFGPG
jgi:diguanylate cyclase (GGDEF)-like protein/PAS domain S-box-containing protein